MSRPHVLKQGNCFAVLDALGDAQATAAAAEGLFFEDTRYLSHLALTIDRARPLLLSSSVTSDDALIIADLTAPDLLEEGSVRAMRDTIHVLRSTVVGSDALFLRLTLENFGEVATTFRLALAVDADFADIFELRGTPRKHRGRRLADEGTRDELVLAYRGEDQRLRRTRLRFSPPPDRIADREAEWIIDLPRNGIKQVEVVAQCEGEARPERSLSWDAALAAARRRTSDREARAARITSSNEAFNEILARCCVDLDVLVTETPQGLYPYAGIPWFSTTFGRDGLITALECLWLDPAVAAGTLRFLAANQATALDDKSDAEPGKILHEARAGEMAILGEVPFGRYYGSIDSTPLFVVLAAAYHARTGDLDLIRMLWPNIEAALDWIPAYGDSDGDGFLEYKSRSGKGLTNQGWKDSGDSIFHADGQLAEAPIALAEVQAYAYAAYQGGARLAAALGRPQQARELARTAEDLRRRFEAAFWLEELGTYAIALDRAKRPCRVRSSNAGQVLFSGIAPKDRAARVVETLMMPQSFSRWGIRTIAEGEPRYNPMSYHNGSVWPHDNGIIALGFGQYGLKQPLLELFSAIVDAAHFMELSRLPELFCGFSRRPYLGPIAHPAACAPQAWSAAAIFAMLGALLGISFDPERRRIVFTQPILPPWLETLQLSNLQLGGASADVLLQRQGEAVALQVLQRHGEIEIVTAP